MVLSQSRFGGFLRRVRSRDSYLNRRYFRHVLP